MFVFIFLFVSSCGASFGEKYVRGNLEIFYTKDIALHWAEDLADYYEKNDLIQPTKHSVQLTSDSEQFILKLVLNSDYDQLPENQTKNLQLFEDELRTSVFNGANLDVVICDINFNPISKE